MHRCHWGIFVLSVLLLASCQKNVPLKQKPEPEENGTAGPVGPSPIACLIMVTDFFKNESMSEAHGRLGFQGIGLGNKILMVLGNNASDSEPLGEVEIYNTTTDSWSVHTISERKWAESVAATGTKIGIAHGLDPYPNQTWWSNNLDLYDINTNTWTVLKTPYKGNAGAGAGYDNKMYFALGNSGLLSKIVEIYNTVTGVWSMTNLSLARQEMAGAATNGKVVFAGGDTSVPGALDVADIYDVNSGTWSTAHLSTPRSKACGAGLGNWIIFAGGGAGHTADMYNTVTGVWSVANITTGYITAMAASGNNIYLCGIGTTVNVFNTCTAHWSTFTLQTARSEYAVGAAADKVVFAGGRLGGAANFTKKAEVYNYHHPLPVF